MDKKYQKPTKPIAKAGRLLLLYRLRQSGFIKDDDTLQKIGNLLGVHRSTVLRDLRVLDQVESRYAELTNSVLGQADDRQTGQF